MFFFFGVNALIDYIVAASHSGCLVDMAVFQFMLSLSFECYIQVDHGQKNGFITQKKVIHREALSIY